MNILVWHLHGPWMTAFVQGSHHYLVPVAPGGGPDGLGRTPTGNWPANVEAIRPEQLADRAVDVVVAQRPGELELARRWLGRALPPVVYVEHDTPVRLPRPTHPMADRDDVVIVHVTAFNQVMWATGGTDTVVIEHGVVDPGVRWSGEVAAAVAVIDEPLRRWWEAGTDLVIGARERVRVDLFGADSAPLGGRALDQRDLHAAIAQRRVYAHASRWTSLGPTLIEAMMLGMPCVVLAVTEVPRAIGPDVADLVHEVAGFAPALASLVDDADRGARLGTEARHYALERFGITRFQADWDALFDRVTDRRPRGARPSRQPSAPG